LSLFSIVSRDSLVGIATRYVLYGPGIEIRWERDVPRRSKTAFGAHPLPIH